jgi:hypothetical protein
MRRGAVLEPKPHIGCAAIQQATHGEDCASNAVASQAFAWEEGLHGGRESAGEQGDARMLRPSGPSRERKQSAASKLDRFFQLLLELRAMPRPSLERGTREVHDGISLQRLAAALFNRRQTPRWRPSKHDAPRFDQLGLQIRVRLREA